MKIDRRFLDAKFIINKAPDGTYLPSNPVAGDIVFSNDGSAEGVHKYDGSNWVEIPPNNADQMEFIDITNGNIIKSDGTAWVVAGTLKIYLYVKNVVISVRSSAPSGDKTGEQYLNTSDYKIYTYDGSNWNAAASTAADGQYLSLDDFNIYTKSGNSHTATSLPDGCIILSEADLSLYAYNDDIELVKLSGGSSGFAGLVTERHTLTSNNISNKYIMLNNPVKSGTTTQALVFVNGVLQDYDVDYTLPDSGSEYANYLYWDDKALEDVVKVGDKFVVQYVPA